MLLSPDLSCSSRDFLERTTFLKRETSSIEASICLFPSSLLAFTYNSSFISACSAYNLRFFCSSSRPKACSRRSSKSSPYDLRSYEVRLTECVLMAGRLASLPNLAVGVEDGSGAVSFNYCMEVVFSRRGLTLTL